MVKKNYQLDVKYFCIGLHKTGTTSLHQMALDSGLKSTHSTDWYENQEKIEQFTFFCDGCSHYHHINEIDYISLYKKFPNSIFIINIRNIRSWIISKLKHAGWHDKTKIVPCQEIIFHDGWKHKSKKNILLFIEHYYERYIGILEFFLNRQDRAVVVDICEGHKENLGRFLPEEIVNKKVHQNKGVNVSLSSEVLEFIDYQIGVVYRDKNQRLQELLKYYSY